MKKRLAVIGGVLLVALAGAYFNDFLGKTGNVLRAQPKGQVAVRFLPTGRQLIVGYDAGGLDVYPAFSTLFQSNREQLRGGLSITAMSCSSLSENPAVRHLAVSSDGKLLAYADDRQIFLDVAPRFSNGGVSFTYGDGWSTSAVVEELKFSPDSRWLATIVADQSSGGNVVAVYSVDSGREVKRFAVGKRCSSIGFSGEGQYLGATADCTNDRIWRVSDWKTVVNGGQLAVSGFRKYSILSAGGQLSPWPTYLSWEARVNLAGTGRFEFATGCPRYAAIDDHTVRVYQVNSVQTKEIKRVRLMALINSVSFAPDGSGVAIGGSEGTVGYFSF